MTTSVLFQIISLCAVAAALTLNLRQNRDISRQTKAGANMAKQTSLREMNRHGADFTYASTSRDPELMAWFLSTRGFPESSAQQNQRFTLLWVRLDFQEVHYLEYLDGLVPDDFWEAWLNMIELDAATPEFAEVWRHTRKTYTKPFQILIDDLLEKIAPPAPITA